MSQLTRRDFIKGSAAAAGVLTTAQITPASESASAKRLATDWVTLGRSGVKVTRMAFGTGSQGGSVQRGLGQEKFTKLVRHAYDRGIRFFESADSYDGMHEMLAEALKGIPRESYKLMTKLRWYASKDAKADIDRFRKELKTDYFDILLLHCLSTDDWPEKLKHFTDALEEAKQNKIILAHGASCHGLKPLKAMPGNDWLDVALLRINHDGTHMDGAEGKWGEKSNRDEALNTIKKIHAQKTGVIGMKLIGNGDFTDPKRRDASIKCVMNLDCVDAVTIGHKSTAEIDESIMRIEAHLNV
jgi:predicted aldo/keto reductase-like oxidoreductase